MIKVQIWSDINCPFCYIGKRHLEMALKKFPDEEIEVEWRSFELDPIANPPKGASQTELLAKKYGRDLEWARAMNNNMTDMASRAGLEFHMEKVVPANSFNAHRLIHLARAHQKQNLMKEKLLHARFTRGIDIGDIEQLKSIGNEVLDSAEITKLFESDSYSSEVRKDELEARKMGISGVPFFLFNDEVALSGAQPPDVLTEVISKLKS